MNPLAYRAVFIEQISCIYRLNQLNKDEICAQFPAYLVLSYPFSVIGYQVFFGVERQLLELVGENNSCSSTLTEQQEKRDDCREKKNTRSVIIKVKRLQGSSHCRYNSTACSCM